MKSDFSEYATKLVNLWLENTEKTYIYYRKRAAELLEDENNDEETAAEMLADEIRANLEAKSPAGSENLYADLIAAALSEVDFIDVANGFLEE